MGILDVVSSNLLWPVEAVSPPLLQESPAPQPTTLPSPPDAQHGLQLVTGGRGPKEPSSPGDAPLRRITRYATFLWRYHRGDYSIAALRGQENIRAEIDALFELAAKGDDYFVSLQEIAGERENERPLILSRLKKMALEGRTAALWTITYLTPASRENADWLVRLMIEVSSRLARYPDTYVLDLYSAMAWIRREIPNGIDLVESEIFHERIFPRLKEISRKNPATFDVFEGLVTAFPEAAFEVIHYLFQVARSDHRVFPRLKNLGNYFFELREEYQGTTRRLGVEGYKSYCEASGLSVRHQTMTQAHQVYTEIKIQLKEMAEQKVSGARSALRLLEE